MTPFKKVSFAASRIDVITQDDCNESFSLTSEVDHELLNKEFKTNNKRSPMDYVQRQSSQDVSSILRNNPSILKRDSGTIPVVKQM